MDSTTCFDVSNQLIDLFRSTLTKFSELTIFGIFFLDIQENKFVCKWMSLLVI